MIMMISPPAAAGFGWDRDLGRAGHGQGRQGPAGGPPGHAGPEPARLSRVAIASGNPYPFTNPPFMSYPMDMTWKDDITTSGIFFGKMSYPCHIHVISDFSKKIYLDIPGIS